MAWQKLGQVTQSHASGHGDPEGMIVDSATQVADDRANLIRLDAQKDHVALGGDFLVAGQLAANFFLQLAGLDRVVA